MKSAIRIIKWTAIISCMAVLIFNALIYRIEAESRAAANKWTTSISTEDHGKYTIQYSYMGERLIFLKLYETATNELLATRTYDSGDMARLYWYKDYLMYDTTDQSWIYDGGIHLPPSKIDKLLTYLP